MYVDIYIYIYIYIYIHTHIDVVNVKSMLAVTFCLEWFYLYLIMVTYIITLFFTFEHCISEIRFFFLNYI